MTLKGIRRRFVFSRQRGTGFKSDFMKFGLKSVPRRPVDTIFRKNHEVCLSGEVFSVRYPIISARSSD
jgi:hypothetical protein